jgi:hypothetical protein
LMPALGIFEELRVIGVPASSSPRHPAVGLLGGG